MGVILILSLCQLEHMEACILKGKEMLSFRSRRLNKNWLFHSYLTIIHQNLSLNIAFLSSTANILWHLG